MHRWSCALLIAALSAAALPEPAPLWAQVAGATEPRAPDAETATDAAEASPPDDIERAALRAAMRLPVEIDGTWGYIDGTGRVVIAPDYAWAGPFHEDRARVNVGGTPERRDGRPTGRIRGGRWGYVNRAGELVVPAKYPRAFRFGDGLAPVALDGNEGYIDRFGRVAIPARFRRATTFVNGVAAVNVNGRWGFIDPAGRVVVAPAYPWVGTFAEGLAPVQKGRRFGYINRKGTMVVKPTFQAARSFHQGLAAVQAEMQTGGDRQRRGRRGRGRTKPRTHVRWGYIDPEGKAVIAPRLSLARDFSEGLAHVIEADGKAGYINREGEMVLPLPDARGGGPFCQGLAAVRTAEGSGYINTKGEMVIAPRFDAAEPFQDGGVARVRLAGRAAYIDRGGALLWPGDE